MILLLEGIRLGCVGPAAECAQPPESPEHNDNSLFVYCSSLNKENAFNWLLLSSPRKQRHLKIKA
jgi:hypothetical protein